MPAGAWSYTPGAVGPSGAVGPYATTSSESGFSSTPPHFHSTTARNHYATHSNPSVACNTQYAYRCDRVCHNQQQGHQQEHQYPYQYQQQQQQQQHHHHHQPELHEQQVQSKDQSYVGNRPMPRAYIVPPALANPGLLPPTSRIYLPPAELQSSSAQSLNSPFVHTCQSPGSAKQERSSFRSLGISFKPFHTGANRMNFHSETPSQSTLQSTTSDMCQRLQITDPLFFGAVPHTRALLANQHHRLTSGLSPNRLGSLRPGSDFYRYD